MTWSKVYTAAAEDANDHNFLVYFFDTYLNGKTDWTITAHPSALAYQRSIAQVLPTNAYTGSSYTNYMWVDWGSVTAPGACNWRGDVTYTTTPGDTGAASNLFRSYGWSAVTTDDNWTIWESSLDTEAWAVYRKRELIFYWPGSQKVCLLDDGLWDGTGTTYRGRMWLFPGGSGSQYGNPMTSCGFINNDNEYYLLPDCGQESWTTGPAALGDTLPVIWEGVQWMQSGWQTTSMSGLSNYSFPVLERTAVDTGYKMGTILPNYRQVNPVNDWDVIVIQDTNSGKYYLHHGTDFQKSCLVFDCGLVEPVI